MVAKETKNKKQETGKIEKYDPSKIEPKWQKKWKETELYKFKEDSKKEKYYPLVELPYPSGDLHIGHWFSFVTADVHARVHKMMGKNVFFTNGYDAFGLPAENAAIKRGIHPKDWTIKNMETMTKQFETMGSMIDWSHTTAACFPDYYKWNQWIFIRMYEKGLAYRGKMLSNWCPQDQTVLANEHVENGKCWRCGSEVVQKEIEQWFIKLTEYADQLIWPEPDKNGLSNGVDWPISVRVAQNQWIGKKEGVKIKHKVIGTDLEFESFSAYPAWSWADRYIVIAPEHSIVKKLVKGTKEEKKVMKFVEEMSKKTDLERQETKEKLGVFTGRYAKDPFGGPDMPIWLANFALINFGTGIIRCSGHDERDIEFAKKYGLKTGEAVVKRENGNAATPHDGMGGILKDSGPFTGRDVWEVVPEVINWIEKQEIGIRFVNYHIHDWSVSRQRYWGTPVPMIHCKKDGIIPVPDDQLPVELPYDVDFTPKGKPPLASNKEWMKVKCPKCGGEGLRDPETLDTFFDSSWYFFRYLNPHYDKAPFSKEDAKKLTPVDIYFGGAEHTLGHTLYARFFTRFFKKLGLVDFDEFAKKRVQHGVILGPDGARMSKSKGNVVNPDDVVKEYGADAARVYLCFMMPYDATAPWAPGGMWGTYRFLKRVWDLQYNLNDKELSKTDLFEMHSAILKVQEDAGSTKFNTGVSTLMKWINYLSAKESITPEEYKKFLLLLAPFAPHIAEEIYQTYFAGDKEFKSIHAQNWPLFDEKYLTTESVTIVIQINGKLRDSIQVESTKLKIQSEIEQLAKKSSKIQKYIEEKKILKTIYIPGKVLNFVVA